MNMLRQCSSSRKWVSDKPDNSPAEQRAFLLSPWLGNLGKLRKRRNGLFNQARPILLVTGRILREPGRAGGVRLNNQPHVRANKNRPNRGGQHMGTPQYITLMGPATNRTHNEKERSHHARSRITQSGRGASKKENPVKADSLQMSP